MEFDYRVEVALAPADVFERLRHFERFYPQLHAAHEPHRTDYIPAPLGFGSRFVVAERFGLEHRRYEFEVTLFEPAIPHLVLTAKTLTSLGAVRVASHLEVDFRLTPSPAGTAVHVIHRVQFANRWLARLLDHGRLWPSIARHVREESHSAMLLLAAPGFPVGSG